MRKGGKFCASVVYACFGRLFLQCEMTGTEWDVCVMIAVYGLLLRAIAMLPGASLEAGFVR